MKEVHNGPSNWATPKWLYNQLDKEFNFDVDVCAEKWNAKHKNYWTVEQDGLKQDWSNKVCFMNPPYGREIVKWVKKAAYEAQHNNATVIGLLPARTDTAWFHDHVLGKAYIRFLRGRIKFEHPNGNGGPPMFGSMIAIWGA